MKDTLTGPRLAALKEANRLLTEITENHDVWCECEWCEARMLTYIDDTSGFETTHRAELVRESEAASLTDLLLPNTHQGDHANGNTV